MTDERRIKICLGGTAADTQVLREILARPGTNLWFQLRKHGIPIGSSCSGVGVCGACAVSVRPLVPDDGEGPPPSAQGPDANTKEHPPLSEETTFEHDTKARHGIPSNKRLACLVRVWGDVLLEDLKSL